MKISLVLLLFSIFQITAKTESSQEQLEFNFTEVSLNKVLKVIKDQSDYNFFYKNNDVNTAQKVSVFAHKESAEIVLDRLFQNTKVSFEIIGKQIILSEKETVSESKPKQER
ncbi:MAG: STN domain-containing protein, partial [Gillisia sp.]|nr:STN domain-containing protein [Gillisia sp.]